MHDVSVARRAPMDLYPRSKMSKTISFKSVDKAMLSHVGDLAKEERAISQTLYFQTVAIYS